MIDGVITGRRRSQFDRAKLELGVPTPVRRVEGACPKHQHHSYFDDLHHLPIASKKSSPLPSIEMSSTVNDHCSLPRVRQGSPLEDVHVA